MKRDFTDVKHIEACGEPTRSVEIYVLATGYRGHNQDDEEIT